ncbi:12510_t:CDS:2 [Acaulospora colombiana]|uniref:12510_t:CDS:1 n=1 Tax=Acaulospora colombiana TaxID=27376 RepID=A0ACA9L3J0_9GLOM|nr:12510_t:CDS:2 [Acaulospora colombiana]
MDTRSESKDNEMETMPKIDRTSSLISDGMDIDQDQSLKPTSERFSESSPKKRGKRKILKKKTYMNAAGFLVSEDVYEWESFSEDELVPKQNVTNEKSKRVKLESPSTKNGANKRAKKKEELSSQKSLLNFFGKA